MASKEQGWGFAVGNNGNKHGTDGNDPRSDRQKWGYDVEKGIKNSFEKRKTERRHDDVGWAYPINSPYVNYNAGREKATPEEKKRQEQYRTEQLRWEAARREASRKDGKVPEYRTELPFERETRIDAERREEIRHEQLRREAIRRAAAREGAPKPTVDTSYEQIANSRRNTAEMPKSANGASRQNGGFSPDNMTPEQKKRYEKAYFEKYGKSPYVQKNTAGASRDGEFYFESDAQKKAQREKEIRDRINRERAYREQIRRQREQRRAENGAYGESPNRGYREDTNGGYSESEIDRNARERREAARREAAQREYERATFEQRRREVEQRRREAEEKLRKKRRRRLVFKQFKFHTAVVLIAALVTFAVIAIILRTVLWSKGDSESKSYSYTYGDTTITGVSAELANPAGDIRINFTCLADLCEFYTAGDGEKMKYVVNKGNEDDLSDGTATDNYISFEIGGVTADINGTSVVLSSETVYTDSSLWVSDDIMDFFTSGISYSVEGRNAVFSRNIAKAKDGTVIRDNDGNATYEEIKLKYSLTNTPETAEVTDDGKDDVKPVNGTPSDVTFTADLSAYEEYMNPSDATPFLVLVNKTTTVDASFIPENLTNIVDTRQDGRATQQMVFTAEKALEAMFTELRACGYDDLSVTSGYRTYEYQEQLFNSYINQEMAKGLDYDSAKAEVLTYSAAPGTSEHQTGLCCDMHNLGAADQAFANEPAYTWLKENCWKFGFIIRFPEGKDDVTGYEFEPWHYRFVGRFTAEKIMKDGICLEEYLNDIGPLD